MMNRSEMIALLSRWDRLGRIELADGTLMWGEAGTGRTNGWMHILSSAYELNEIQPFLEHNSFSLPYKHWTAWTEWAGFRLFKSRFNFWGPHLTSGTPRHRHTFDIVFENRVRPWALKRFDGIIFGDLVSNDAEFFLLERRHGPVLAINRNTEQPVFEWRGFDTCLRTLLDRFCAGFDNVGEISPGFVISDFS